MFSLIQITVVWGSETKPCKCWFAEQHANATSEDISANPVHTVRPLRVVCSFNTCNQSAELCTYECWFQAFSKCHLAQPFKSDHMCNWKEKGFTWLLSIHTSLPQLVSRESFTEYRKIILGICMHLILPHFPSVKTGAFKAALVAKNFNSNSIDTQGIWFESLNSYNLYSFQSQSSMN